MVPCTRKAGQTYLWKRAVYLQVSSSEDMNEARVRLGNFEVPLQKVEAVEEVEKVLPLRGDFRLRTSNELLPTNKLDGSRTLVTVEAVETTTASLSQSVSKIIQLKLPPIDHPYYFNVGPRISLNLLAHHTRAEVRLLAAVQESDVEVSIRFSSAQTGQDYVVEVALDPKFKGGDKASDFQIVNVQCPFDGSCTASIALIVKQNVSQSNGAGLCYIANAEVVAAINSHELSSPLMGVANSLEKGQWYKACLNSLLDCDGATIELVNGEYKEILLNVQKNNVFLEENFGHGVTLRAQRRDDFILAINSAPLKRISLDNAATFVPIPIEFLNGEPLELTLLDSSSSQLRFTYSILGLPLITPSDALREHSRAPYPTELSTRQAFRYKGLKAALADTGKEISLPSIRNSVDALDEGLSSLKFSRIQFPIEAEPLVSVIIPAHNNAFVTFHCLCALLVAANRVSFEVIVVDDGSTDETLDLPTFVDGVTFIRNELPQRFIRACNEGVKVSRGKYVALLNNDTEPTVGWLDTLVRAMEERPNAGLVGSKLLYPDGRLQDAGGIVWSSGNPWNYGNAANPWHPKYSYTRQVDYLSGAALMTSRNIWDQIGGLSSYLEPMYFEDTDLSFKVREAGYYTYFVPSSIVYHFEGMTSGTDTTSGFKRYQEINRPKFKKRWASAFSKHGKEGIDPDLEKDRNVAGRILFVDGGIPREDRDAGSYAARREMELVQSLGYKVTFLPQNLAHLGFYTDNLAETGVEVIHAPFYRSMREFFAQRGTEFDAVYMTRYHVAQATLPLVREFCPTAKTILNNADLHFLRELRAAMNARDPNRLKGMRDVRDQELAVMREVDLVLSYNNVERVVISTHTDGQAKVMECPWVIRVPEVVPILSGRSGLSFLGSFTHLPNREAMAWFCKDILPQLADSCRKLHIYGSGIDDEIQSLESDAVDVVGFVEDVSMAYQHRVFVAPLLSGAGVKGKVLSALAHGIPTVLTPIAAEGIEIRSGVEAVIAETPEQWIHHIEELMTNQDAWSAMSDAAVRFARERYSFFKARDKMRAAFEAVDLFGQV